MGKNVSVISNCLLYQWNILHYSAGQPYCSAKFLSLRTGDEVHNIPYTEPITDIRANDRYDYFFVVVITVKYRVCRFFRCCCKYDFDSCEMYGHADVFTSAKKV